MLIARCLLLEEGEIAFVVDQSANIPRKDEIGRGAVEVEGEVLLADFEVEVGHVLEECAGACGWRRCAGPGLPRRPQTSS